MSASETQAFGGVRLDRLCMASAAGIALAVYASTMCPGLAGIGDTPKFQFVGAVLGTPHSPGYPLYTLLSWLFAQLPVGSVAFRMNLLSAVAGSLATGLMAGVLLELGCRPIVAFAGAAAIAFGRVFWSQAVLAEVYTVNAALFSAAVLFLLRWEHTKAFKYLVWALAMFSAGLAHHLTLAMTAPAMLVFALLCDRRIVTWRSVRAAAIACAAGFASYLLLWVRTWQHAPFLEVRANTLSDLIGIITARQFQHALFRFSVGKILTIRLPLMVHWLAGELRWTGVALLAVGVLALAMRRRRDLWLLAGCVATVTAFAIDYDVYDIHVFLIIPMIACGLLAGAGLQATYAALSRNQWLRAAAALLVLAIPFGQLRANFRVNDFHRHTFEAAYFGALFSELPPRTAFVAESYTVDHMLLYMLLGERAGKDREIEVIPPEPEVVRRYAESGFTVLAFENARSALGIDVPFRAVDMTLPRPRAFQRLVDTEAPELAYPLSVAEIRQSRSATSLDPPPEPMTGAVWRVANQ